LYDPSVPRYLIIRSFEVSEDQMPPIGRRSRELTETEFPEITWDHSHVVLDDVVDAVGVNERFAPNEDLLREHARKLGKHTLDAVYEIAGDVTPADFPPATA
jgi:hypothetical protein